MAETHRKETKQFKAEVSQVLDIVIHSLYTHREIFVRELVSNAFDALEKLRHETLTAGEYADPDAPLEIRIDMDTEAHTLRITDTGIGMTRDDLVNNLGTIARSGTLEFMKGLAAKGDEANELIGKFGVGFYSAFMAAESVTVETRSYLPGEPAYRWTSDGIGKYTIEGIDDRPRGTSITLALREDAREFETVARIKEIIKKYSNFVSYPIVVDGERVNTVQAIWLKSASEVTEDEYAEFFKFIDNTEQEPLYHLHLTADAPIQLASILYVPSMNMEQFGFMRMKPQVNLYTRKILLQQNVEELLPDYLRFVIGVVDSADLTLNISRETIQDNLVFRKLGKFLTKRVLKFLGDQATKDPDTYKTFWDTFGVFIKEGATADFEHRTEIINLLRFKSSAVGEDELTTLADYVARAREDQTAIYYLSGRSRTDIEEGPYLASFRKRGIEVLYLYDAIDDFVMTTIGEFEGKKLVSADASDIELPDADADTDAEKEETLDSGEVSNLTSWLKETLGNRVTEVRESKRALDRPAIIVNPDQGMTTSMRRIMKAAGRDTFGPGPQVLEINTHHPLVTTLQKLRDSDADKGFLQSCAEQLYDGALAEAGLMENPRDMVGRMYAIMEKALGSMGGKE